MTASRHFLSAYIHAGDALDDYRDVIGRAKQEPEPSTGMCGKGAAYGSIQNDGSVIPSLTGYPVVSVIAEGNTLLTGFLLSQE